MIKWNDDAAMLALVEDAFLEWEMNTALDEAARYEAGYIDPDVTVADFYGWIEQDAIEAAKAGNFKPLVDIRRGRNPMVRDFQNRFGMKPSAEAEELIDRRLLGQRRVKAGRGVAKKSNAEREASPTFCAAQEVPAIERMLRHHFPKQRGIKTRAIELAAMRAKLTTDTLVNFLRKQRDK